MARRAKWVAAGVYQPALDGRRAYGRRRTSAPLVEDAAGIAVAAHTAPRWLPRRAVPMPHGGVRMLLACPCCRRWATQLYALTWLARQDVSPRYACRRCLGLRYQSQYQGRRPEAHRSARQHLAATARTARTAATRERRQRRYLAAVDTHCKRAERGDARRDTAYLLAAAVLLAREVNRENRQWARRILPAVLREPNLDARRQIAEHPDTPAWARQAILASLPAVSVPLSDTKQAETRMKRAAKRDIAALVSEERIAEMRAKYAAMGQPRRLHSAA